TAPGRADSFCSPPRGTQRNRLPRSWRSSKPVQEPKRRPDEEAAKKRVVFVETGKDRIKTTEFDVLLDHANECQFLRRVKAIRDGSFRVVTEDGKTFTEGNCRCCTEFQQDRVGEEYIPRARVWVLHGHYFR